MFEVHLEELCGNPDKKITRVKDLLKKLIGATRYINLIEFIDEKNVTGLKILMDKYKKGEKEYCEGGRFQVGFAKLFQKGGTLIDRMPHLQFLRKNYRKNLFDFEKQQMSTEMSVWLKADLYAYVCQFLARCFTAEGNTERGCQAAVFSLMMTRRLSFNVTTAKSCFCASSICNQRNEAQAYFLLAEQLSAHSQTVGCLNAQDAKLFANLAIKCKKEGELLYEASEWQNYFDLEDEIEECKDSGTAARCRKCSKIRELKRRVTAPPKGISSGTKKQIYNNNRSFVR